MRDSTRLDSIQLNKKKKKAAAVENEFVFFSDKCSPFLLPTAGIDRWIPFFPTLLSFSTLGHAAFLWMTCVFLTLFFSALSSLIQNRDTLASYHLLHLHGRLGIVARFPFGLDPGCWSYSGVDYTFTQVHGILSFGSLCLC